MTFAAWYPAPGATVRIAPLSSVDRIAYTFRLVSAVAAAS